MLIKRAALGNLKASFHCTHWHRFFPLKKAFFYLSVSPARKDFFRKPTRPSLPLRKAPPLISVFSPQGRRGKPPYSVLFFRFPPSPFSQRELHLQPSLPPQKEGCNRPTRCSEPLRSKVGGPSKVFAMVVRDGTAGSSIAYLCYINQRSDCDRVGYIQIGSLYIYTHLLS